MSNIEHCLSFFSRFYTRNENLNQFFCLSIKTVFFKNELSGALKIPLLGQTLIRARPTKTQAFLKEKERWTNVQDAFKIKHPQAIKGKSFLIIDDLMTTGATVCETAIVLKNAGAQKVEALTLAIA